MPDLIPEERYGLARTDRQRSNIRVSKVVGGLLAGIGEVLAEYPELTDAEVLCALVQQADRWAQRVCLDEGESDA